MKLHGRIEDSRTLCVRATANLCGSNYSFEPVTQELRKGLSNTGKLPVLRLDDRLVAFSANACARLLASDTLKGENLLGGKNSFMQSEVAQWVEFSHCIEKFCNVMNGDEFFKSAPGDDIVLIKAAAQKELIAELQFVENHLATQTYLVGEALTFADISLCCTLISPMASAFDEKVRLVKLQNVTRWFKTVLGQAKLDSLLREPFAFYGSSKVINIEAPNADMLASSITEAFAAPLLPSVTSGLKTSIPLLFRRGYMRIKDLLYTPNKGEEYVGKQVKVCGWARTIREGGKGKIVFVELSDGSCVEHLQVIAEKGLTAGFVDILSAGGTDSSYCFIGTIVASPAKGQAIELKATAVSVLGTVDQDTYPLKKTGHGTKSHSLEFLRENAHLRARTKLIGAVARVRNACSQAVHQFFRDREFLYVHTPLITASDCEGAGEMFQVTTLLSHAEKNCNNLPLVDAKEAKARTNEVFPPTVGDIDYRKDFFGVPTYLTVSGQLNVETYACSLSDVYTFGPTFRAENSHTSRHLAEFWMIEPEICFSTLKDVVDLAEDFLKYLVQYVLDHCSSDIEFFDDRVEKGLCDRLRNVVDSPFQRMTYTEAIELLNKPENLTAGAFDEEPVWGIDLGSEHERYLAEKIFKKPVVLTDYPASIKAFYMKLNNIEREDRQTVQAMDIIVPRLGEIIGGSAREENLGKLTKRITALGLDVESFKWYLDLRRYGTVPHGGFGLGFERLVMFVTGMANIRDIIPFPRHPNNCAF